MIKLNEESLEKLIIDMRNNAVSLGDCTSHWKKNARS